MRCFGDVYSMPIVKVVFDFHNEVKMFSRFSWFQNVSSYLNVSENLFVLTTYCLL